MTRIFDGAVSLTLLVLLAPVMAVIAFAVRRGSPGPALFRQIRVGRDGVPFQILKFRTMVRDAERRGARLTGKQDTRITPLGRRMRRAKLDELPQLWNVLRGDLSLVGPRPEQGRFVERFSETIPFYTHRHLVRPGVTGWAQVKYGYADSEADTVEKLSYDLYYVKHVSPWLDLEILGKSIWTVLSGFGAR